MCIMYYINALSFCLNCTVSTINIYLNEQEYEAVWKMSPSQIYSVVLEYPCMPMS
jgi:hypothetical protein